MWRIDRGLAVRVDDFSAIGPKDRQKTGDDGVALHTAKHDSRNVLVGGTDGLGDLQHVVPAARRLQAATRQQILAIGEHLDVADDRHRVQGARRRASEGDRGSHHVGIRERGGQRLKPSVGDEFGGPGVVHPHQVIGARVFAQRELQLLIEIVVRQLQQLDIDARVLFLVAVHRLRESAAVDVVAARDHEIRGMRARRGDEHAIRAEASEQGSPLDH
ncbi:hypothetical protein OKW43_007179 [Paraburkholderia sp. WC7.3g]